MLINYYPTQNRLNLWKIHLLPMKIWIAMNKQQSQNTFPTDPVFPGSMSLLCFWFSCISLLLHWPCCQQGCFLSHLLTPFTAAAVVSFYCLLSALTQKCHQCHCGLTPVPCWICWSQPQLYPHWGHPSSASATKTLPYNSSHCWVPATRCLQLRGRKTYHPNLTLDKAACEQWRFWDVLA